MYDINKIIEDNKYLIYSIIRKYSKYYDFDDLYQVSVIGIIKAMKNYKRDYNIKISTYIYKYIMGEVYNYINNDRQIKISNEYVRLYKKIKEARCTLTQELMKEVNNSEIASFLGVSDDVVNDCYFCHDCIRSLDDDSLVEGNITLYDKIKGDNDISIDRIYLRECLNSLSDEELDLIYLRYYKDKTQEEAANCLNMNQVSVSRNEKKILSKLRGELCKI